MLIIRKLYRLIVISAVFSFLLFGNVLSKDADSLGYNIINSVPSPGPSPYGLAWDGVHLWVNDDSTDTIYKLNPIDGSIISFFPTPGPVPTGLTWDGTHLWCQDSILDSIYKIDSTDASVIKSIPAPSNFVFGLTWDGNYLWSAYFLGWSSEVVQVDTTYGTAIRSFLCVANGLAFDGEFLWSVKSSGGVHKGFVKKHNYYNGMEIFYFRTPGYNPTGLTFDSKCFWLADSDADTIYQIEVITTNVEKYNKDPFLKPTFKLYNYPNPFNQTTLIFYELPSESKACLRIFNIKGQLIKILDKGKIRIGHQQINWDGKDSLGQNIPSGIYFIRLDTNDFSKSMKITLIK